MLINVSTNRKIGYSFGCGPKRFVVPSGPAPQVSVEVIQRTPVEGDTIAITPLGSRRTMLLLSEIDNSVPFTCSLTVDTNNMKLGDELFVSSRYLIYTGNTPISKFAAIVLPSNMIILRCGIFSASSDQTFCFFLGAFSGNYPSIVTHYYLILRNNI